MILKYWGCLKAIQRQKFGCFLALNKSHFSKRFEMSSA